MRTWILIVYSLALMALTVWVAFGLRPRVFIEPPQPLPDYILPEMPSARPTWEPQTTQAPLLCLLELTYHADKGQWVRTPDRLLSPLRWVGLIKKPQGPAYLLYDKRYKRYCQAHIGEALEPWRLSRATASTLTLAHGVYEETLTLSHSQEHPHRENE